MKDYMVKEENRLLIENEVLEEHDVIDDDVEVLVKTKTVHNQRTFPSNISCSTESLSSLESCPIHNTSDTCDTSYNPNNEGENEYPNLPWYKLFVFASRGDIFKYVIGFVCAILTGFSSPISNVGFGKLTALMVDYGAKFNTTGHDCIHPSSNTTSVLMSQAVSFVYLSTGITIGQFIVGYTMVYCFSIVAENQVHKIRIQYFRSLIRQNMGWFDTNAKMDFSNRIIEDMGKIQEAINEKMGFCVYEICSIIIFLNVCFYSGWKLTVLMSFTILPLILLTYYQAAISNSLTSKEQDAYADAGAVVEEVLTNIRTVTAFGGEEKEISRYETNLAKAKKFLVRRAVLLGLLDGLVYFFVYSSFSVSFWYGTKLILESRESGDNLYNPGVLVLICFGMQSVGFYIGQAAEHFKTFGKGIGAGRAVFELFGRTSEIDPFSELGEIPKERARGEIEFDSVYFSYPSRPAVEILKNFTIKINPGQTVAFVGHSGCGKSTAIQLLQRFYDPLSGQIKLDGVNIRDLNIGWLRSQMGVVGQEPVLFNCSIRENIAMGYNGATDAQVKDAAFKAYAEDFISKLPMGYDTFAGERGAQLSGGQKQRVAIARALIRNPAILLLDEATSALDMQSEAIVQAALERARHGRTTIIVAHRLSTIQAADVVIAIKDGKIEEFGNHEELMAKKGIYYQLVLSQSQIKTPIIDPVTANLDKELLEPTFLGSDCNLMVQNFRKKSIDTSEENKILVKNFKLMRLIKMTSEEWPYTFLAFLLTLIKGSYFAFYAIIFGTLLGAFTSSDETYIQDQANFYSLLYLILGIIIGLASFFQHYFATKSGDAFTLRIRKLIFRLLLRQDMTFYDEQENTVGNLCARLSTDATSIQGATGDRLLNVFLVLAITGFSLSVGFYYMPKMGIFCSIYIPITILSSMLEGKVLQDENILEKVAIENAANIAVEALKSIKLVSSFGLENHFLETYINQLEKSHRINQRRAKLRGLSYGIAQSIPYVAFSINLLYGIYLVEHDCANIADVWKVSEALVYGVLCADAFLLFAPEYEKGKLAGARIFKLLDRAPMIDKTTMGDRIDNPKGKVSFQNIFYNYTSRPTLNALKNINMTIRPSENVAIVGVTGSGKSTLISLLLRFYDPSNGQITLDSINLKNLNIHNLRSHLALVAQEPILFNFTIAENIAYGDNNRDVSMDDIITAARAANIHEFIVSLPAGYETKVGALGSQLSGGQKQRIAISRALIKNPKVLILDEATSALDSESERIVQEALVEARMGRTSITIAHRLSSIQNCDKIFVMSDGMVVEEGKHEELLSLKDGNYHAMWYAQRRAKSQRHKSMT